MAARLATPTPMPLWTYMQLVPSKIGQLDTRAQAGQRGRQFYRRPGRVVPGPDVKAGRKLQARRVRRDFEHVAHKCKVGVGFEEANRDAAHAGLARLQRGQPRRALSVSVQLTVIEVDHRAHQRAVVDDFAPLAAHGGAGGGVVRREPAKNFGQAVVR